MTDQKKIYFCNTKEGRKKYYDANKAKITKQQQEKEKCSCCGRVVAHGQMPRHQETAYCKKRGVKSKEMTTFLEHLKQLNDADDGLDEKQKFDRTCEMLNAFCDEQPAWMNMK